MSITITKQWLKDNGADSDPIEWFERQTETDPIKLADIALDDDHFDYINWVIIRKMTRSQFVAYAIFAADLVLDIYATKYPNDNRPRKAIEATKAYLATNSVANAAHADAAHITAHVAAAAAAAAGHANAAHAAHAAAHAAHAAAHAAHIAAYADDTADIVAAVTDAAANAAGAASDAVRKQIVQYGIFLLAEQK